MRVLINNFDGLGLVDYTACVQFGRRTIVHRVLNGPSTCKIPTVLRSGFAMPQMDARLVVQSNGGAYLFTGFIGEPPTGVCAGITSAGSVEEYLLFAVSDEAQLDAAVWEAGTTVLGGTAAQNWAGLNALSTAAGLQVRLADDLAAASRVAMPSGGRWSELAGNLASSTRSSYRVLNSVVDVLPAGTNTYVIEPNDPGLTYTTVNPADLRWLATDVTVTGHAEPDAYITEVFAGDGVTASFSLTEKPFHLSATQGTTIQDTFQGTSLNGALWTVDDPGGHIGLTAGGLTCAGGSGRDGESSVSSVQSIEVGGNLLIEANGVQLSSGSAGMVLGLYTGVPVSTDCFAGFSIDTVQGTATLTALINGTTTGAVFSIASDRLYILRLRVHASEVQRIQQTYYYQGSTGAAAAGGATVSSSGWVSLEVQDITNGVSALATVLYSGKISAIPVSCKLGVLASGSLVCSIKSVLCTQSAPMQVMIGGTDSAPTPVVLGSPTEGAACRLATTDTITFFPATIPPPSSLIYVSYRSSRFSAARRSLHQGSRSSSTATLSWAGRVTRPAAWSSADCESAAAAILGFAASGAVALKGTYNTVRVFNAYDIWPGDGLILTPNESAPQATTVVRSVDLALLDAEAEVTACTTAFASDWIAALSIHLSSDLPAGASVPDQPTNLDQAAENASALTLQGVSATALTLSVGIEAPINGGFEVRRRDNTFGAGTDSDLVLRTAASTFTLPRLFAVEQFYVRMYDGSSPARYSAKSAAIFTNIPT